VLFRPVVALRVASIPIGGFGARVPAAAAAAETFCCGRVECVYALQQQEDNACLQNRFDGMGKVVAAVGLVVGNSSLLDIFGFFFFLAPLIQPARSRGLCVMKNAKRGDGIGDTSVSWMTNALLKIAGVCLGSDVNRSIRWGI